jgi:hypothetical protein
MPRPFRRPTHASLAFGGPPRSEAVVHSSRWRSVRPRGSGRREVRGIERCAIIGPCSGPTT